MPCDLANNAAPAGIPGKPQRAPDTKRIQFSLAYVNPEDSLLAAKDLRTGAQLNAGDIRILIECTVMFEAVRPFLEALQRADPMNLPFADYLRHANPPRNVVGLPAYSAEPGFKWDLSERLREEEEATPIFMDPTSKDSVRVARERLVMEGKLDPR